VTTFSLKSIHNVIEGWFSLRGDESRAVFFLKQFIWFGYLEAISCVFPVLIFLSLALSSVLNLGLPRYDLLFLVCILAQVVMYKSGLETRDEVYVITLFHVLGLIMELHKVHRGSWSYPEAAFTKVLDVPLYSGFMYASVGCYICQAWRNLRVELVDWPRDTYAIGVGAAIYLNFFTNAFISDLRLYIFTILMMVFWKTKFRFRLHERVYQMYATLAFALVGFFIWVAENVATFFGAWKYAYQHRGWQMVAWHKITSWGLLVIVSFIIVAQLKRVKAKQV
jgi:uncharacterized membrane protein YoaT (DUF817 family)